MGNGSSSNGRPGGSAPPWAQPKGRGFNNPGGYQGPASNGGINPQAGIPGGGLFGGGGAPRHSDPMPLPQPRHSEPMPLPMNPGGSPGSVVHGGFGPQAFGVPGGTGPMLPADARQNFRDARDSFRGMRDNFNSMAPWKRTGDARDEFIAARDQFHDQRDQFRGQGPTEFPGQGGGAPDWVRNLFQRGR